MADTKVQNPATEQQRGITRRQENYPSREIFNYSPFALMRRFSDEMDRVFSSAFGFPSSFGSMRGMGDLGAWAPPVEVRERDGNIEISAELPGLNKDEVKVECTDEGIIIEGERRREHESGEGSYHRSERSYGRFYRMLPLPEGAQTDKAKAEFKNGVLEVRVPVSEEHRRKTRQIPIST
jgi:HSP20 family protein